MDLTTVITLTGPKANVVKILNAGILSLGFTNLVEDGDDLGAVIQKVTGDAMVFQFQDLLNTTGEPLPRTRIPMDEDYSEFNEDFGLKVADIIENEQSLTVILYYWTREDFFGYDLYGERDFPQFLYDAVRQYGLEAEFVTGGEEFPKYASSFRLENAATGEVTQSRFEPFSEYRGYQMALDNLTKLNREKFLQFEINSLEHLIDSLKNELEDLKADYNRPDENPGATATAPAKGNDDEELPF
ncbi:MAG: hypothetical protein J5639_02165 [Bacteroidales bacterium]|nr:hypothetical protein [Bacteroidales bacterium]